MEKRLSLALAGTGLLVALLLITAGHRRPLPGAEIEAVAADLDALVRETTAGVQARADTLSQLPRLGWIVATDEATVGDLTADELEFRPHAGEHIELAQLRKSDGQVRVLRRLPAGNAVPLSVARPGLHLLIAGERIHVVTVVAIQPRARTGELRGALAVAQVLDTTSVARRLDALGVSGRLQTPAGSSATLGHGPPVVSADAVAAPLNSPAAMGVVLVASRGAKAWWVRLIPWLLLALAFGGAGVLWQRGAGRAAAASPVRLATAGSVRSGTVGSVHAPPSAPAGALDGGVPIDEDDGGDSELTYDPDATVLADAVPSPQMAISRARTGSVPIVISQAGNGPRRTRTPVPSAAGETDPTTEEYRALFLEFASLRRTCGEPVADLDRDEFVETLRNARERLIREDHVKDVRFRLAFANGRAVIRFTTVP